MEIRALNGNQEIDITDLVINLEVESSIYRYKKACSFKLLDNRTNNLIALDPLQVADMVRVTHENEILFEGIIVTQSSSVRGEINYICYDWGFYLESSKKSFYFEDEPYNTVITRVLEDLGFRVRISMLGGLKITKLFKSVSGAEILNYVFGEVYKRKGKIIDISFVSQTEVDLLETDRQKYLDGDRSVVKTFDVKIFDQTLDFLELTERKYSEKSFENLKNKVIVNSYNGNSINEELILKDQESIDKFGELTEIIEKKANDEQTAYSIANNVLVDKNKISESLDLSIAKGNVKIKVGDVLELNDDTLRIVGAYEVASINFIFENGQFKMDLNLEVIN